MSKRNFVIAGNWKMNCTPSEATALSEELVKAIEGKDLTSTFLACPPYISISAALEKASGSQFKIGAQNVHQEDSGAYTGEIAANMIKDAGCEFVIIGHSERREYFGETDATVNTKVRKALEAGLTPIVCVGEVLEERKANEHEAVVSRQVKEGLSGFSADELGKMIIAYEPVWAIGTGEVATPDQAEEMHKGIRGVLTELADEDTAESIAILYGGSMKPGNAEELLKQPNVDGGLIGGASLKTDSFTAILDIAEKLS